MFKKEQINRISSWEDVFQLSGKDFEWFVKFLLNKKFPKLSISVTKKGKNGGDNGIDLIFRTKENEIIYSQVKRWKKNKGKGDFMSVKFIRELGGCMLRDGIKRGVFISTLPFSHIAEREAEKMKIKLIDPVKLKKYLKEINPKFESKPVQLNTPKYQNPLVLVWKHILSWFEHKKVYQ